MPLGVNFATKVHEQVKEITNNVRLRCRANLPLQLQTSVW